MLHNPNAHRPEAGRIDLIGIPTDAGASCRGAVMGPSALRASGLAEGLERLGYGVRDFGDFNTAAGLCARDEIADLAQLSSAAGYASLRDGACPVFLGGDHSISMGSVAGVARQCAEAGRPLFVLWLDAHGDFNTPSTTETGNIHGMSLAMLCGEPEFTTDPAWFAPVDPANVMVLGARDLDCLEAELLDTRGVEVVPMGEIRVIGFEVQLRRFLDRVVRAGGHLHLSLDVDAMDPSIAPGVGTTVADGFSRREAHRIMAMIRDSRALGSLDIVELNPTLDRADRSAKLLVAMTETLFGEPPPAAARRALHETTTA